MRILSFYLYVSTTNESEENQNDFYNETSWTTDINGEPITITIHDVEDYLDSVGSPIVEIPVNKIFHMCVHKGKKDPQTIKRSQESDLSYPIIIARNKSGKLSMILDGHHRLLKAKNEGHRYIKSRILDLSNSPIEFQEMFS